MNQTVTSSQELHTSSSGPGNELDVILGLPAVDFYAIHYTALVVLSFSGIASCGVLISLVACSKTRFRGRPIGERLVVYLASCDLVFSTFHCMDHGCMLVTEDYPPEALCRLFAVMLMTFILAQSIIVTFTAANCFYMVVMERRFTLGAYDLRLLLPTLGVPLVLSISAAVSGLLGPGPSWCFIDITHKYAYIASSFTAISLLTVMITNMLLYGIVLGKLKKAGGATRKGKYDSLAKTLTVFVAVYILQYFPGVVTSLWSMAKLPPIQCVGFTVIFTNLGGVFNFLAYTLQRRRSKRTNPRPDTIETIETTKA